VTEQLATLSRGTVLDSRYHLQRLLGRGGMASVWLATDDALARAVAVKIVADTLACDVAWLKRFQREAKTIAGLNHPNIVRIFDYGVDHGRPFLVMEYLGRTLIDAVDDDSPPDLERIARELLSAVAHMHAVGLVHRDIKPSNVLLADDGSPRLTDFGIAFSDEATRLTSTGMVIGSARYLAPEVLEGAPASRRSDLFSLGRLLEELASRVERPPRLARLIRCLTEPAPAARPRSANEALAMLGSPNGARRRARAPLPRAAELVASATTLLRERATIAARALPPRKRRPAARALAALALALLATAAILALTVPGDGSPAAPSARGANGQARAARAPSSPPPPAPARAPLTRQLDALAARIAFAARR
jgi:serine/threonine protein kinase